MPVPAPASPAHWESHILECFSEVLTSQEPGAGSREEALPSVDSTLARESCCHRETFWGERLFTTNAWDCQEIIGRN